MYLDEPGEFGCLCGHREYAGVDEARKAALVRERNRCGRTRNTAMHNKSYGPRLDPFDARRGKRATWPG
jgi:hypothetical protein